MLECKLVQFFLSFSGLIGRSWAMLFAGAGYHVSMYDVSLDLVDKAIKDIDEQLKALEKSGMLRGTTTAAQQLALVSGIRKQIINIVVILSQVFNF